jgi:flagellar hook-basal body complex protein FliE
MHPTRLRLRHLQVTIRNPPWTSVFIARPHPSLPAATDRPPDQTSAKAEAQGNGFSTELESALRSVSASQNHSSHLQKEVQLENPSVSLEETMVAMQKAQIGFQATLHVRNRLVRPTPM